MQAPVRSVASIKRKNYAGDLLAHRGDVVARSIAQHPTHVVWLNSGGDTTHPVLQELMRGTKPSRARELYGYSHVAGTHADRQRMARLLAGKHLAKNKPTALVFTQHGRHVDAYVDPTHADLSKHLVAHKALAIPPARETRAARLGQMAEHAREMHERALRRRPSRRAT